MYASNNSYLFEKRHTDKGVVYLSQKFLEVEESLLLNGEPGVMFLEAARAYGRMADAPNYKDAKACGSNPWYVNLFLSIVLHRFRSISNSFLMRFSFTAWNRRFMMVNCGM
jgi:hypothetical protein